MVFSGSSNWGNLAFTSDEQMQRILSYRHTRQHLAGLHEDLEAAVLAQAGAGRVYSFGRMLPGAPTVAEDLIPEEPVFGEGIYKYLPED